jgi:hypothetical protein
MPEDIENILNDAAEAELAQEVMDMPVLPAEHPEVVEFEQCWERMYEIAKKNGWLFCASMVRQHSRDGVQQTGNGIAVTISHERLAKNFALFGMPGVLAAQAYTASCQELGRLPYEHRPHVVRTQPAVGRLTRIPLQPSQSDGEGFTQERNNHDRPQDHGGAYRRAEEALSQGRIQSES